MWLEQRVDLLAGRKPAKKDSDAYTVANLCSEFASRKEHKHDKSELAISSFRLRHEICGRIVPARAALPLDPKPEDFGKLLKELAE